jgi:hypothetical protein
MRTHGVCRRIPVIAVVFVCAAVAPAWAQVPPTAPPSVSPQEEVQRVRADLESLRKEFEALRQQYDQRIAALEQRIGSLVPTPAPPPAVGPPQASPTVPQVQSLAGASKVFNPDIAVVGNFVGVAGKNPFSSEPSLSVREVEIAFQSIVDPFARADFFLSASPEGLEVEEGFVTFTALPAGLLLKVGKMRASFGKVNTLHTHAMPTGDRPLVTENLVGGEEGISDSGLSVSKLILNPAIYLEAVGEVSRGESEVFQTSRRSKLNYVGRLRAYRDLTESTNLDFGTSVAFGPTNLVESLDPTFAPMAVDLNKRLIGVDATFRYRPLRRAIYRRLLARTELFWSRQDLPAGLDRPHAFGLYGLGEYQFARRWYAGARYDQSQRVLDASLEDRGGSLFLTFWPSEFSQIRVQYRRTNFAEGRRANDLLFQFRFGIGAHAAHVF